MSTAEARFLWPRWWPTWLALWLLRTIARWPYDRQLAFGAALGDIVRRLPLSQRRVVRRNLALCLPEKSAAERAELLQRHFREVGITVAETAVVWFASDARIRELVQFEGLEELDRVTAAGRGAILLAAHFTTLEIGARCATATRRVHAVYKPSKNALVTEFFRKYRGAHAAGMIASDDIRKMVRVLRAGGVVWYAPDQAFRGKGALMVPFFGIEAASNPATSRLAALTGAAVLPYFVERLPGTAGYRVRIAAPLENFPSDDPQADTRRIHALIEAEVRRNPAQYLWLHKRFKSLGDDRPEHYA